MEVVANAVVAIVLKCTSVSNQRVVGLKFTQLLVNYIFIKLEKKTKLKIVIKWNSKWENGILRNKFKSKMNELDEFRNKLYSFLKGLIKLIKK